MRRAAKVDANQPGIVRDLRRLGYHVEPIHMVGRGVPDLIVTGPRRPAGGHPAMTYVFRHGHDLPTGAIIDDPYQRLVAAVIDRARRDLDSNNTQLVHPACDYFSSPDFEEHCDFLNLDPTHIRRNLLPERPMQPILNDDQVRAIHADYTRSRRSIATLAAEHHVAAGTLYRAFARLGLPLRRRGRKPASTADLQRILDSIAAAGHTVVRVTVIDLAPTEEEPQS